jgi:predicted DNA-binding protein
MQKTKNRPITAFPTDELRKRIDDYSRETGVPISEIVRRALDEYISRNEKPKSTRR